MAVYCELKEMMIYDFKNRTCFKRVKTFHSLHIRLYIVNK